MENTELHRDDYRVHRNCASCLITLLRGSKVNKNKLSVACSDVASSLQNSTDFFFQMQCSEILFRLYTHNTTVLMQAEMDVQLRKGIMELPNDSTILLNIQAFLDRYNSESRANIMPYTVLRIEVDGAEICGHTTMYFSELLLVTLLPGGNGDNFTIPFEHIRSVKLSKDHKLGLRLNSIPAKLSSAMAVDTPKDTFNVFLTQSMLQKIRTCGIHQWIAKRKQTAPLRIQQSHTPLRIESEARAAKSVEAIASVPSISERRPNVSGASSLTASRKESRMRDGSHLDDIHRAATIKTARHREERMGELQEVSDKINQKLDDLKHLNARDRDSAETSFRDDMAKVRMAEAELKESASNCVQTLNAELEDIQALGALLKAEIDKLREKMAKASGRSEGVEEASLLRIKQLVDQNVKEMELSAANLLVASNPLHTVGEYIVQKTKYQ
ncbi:hypothetical protein AGDE_06088 [Angomonas deanei]|nr:hypothetical protein AGDE_06088 [Angomonas deanei]|eukprot:EPY37845.1 hypothetical protein AGDE_06088 [Angomonas deanei]